MDQAPCGGLNAATNSTAYISEPNVHDAWVALKVIGHKAPAFARGDAWCALGVEHIDTSVDAEPMLPHRMHTVKA